MYNDVRYTVENGIATLTFDRPEAYNAFTEATIEELNHALNRAAEDEDAFVIVLTGAGDGFCTGADVTSMPDWSDKSKEEYSAFLTRVQDFVRQLRGLAKPSAAAVNGPAVGAGCDFALACDVRFIAPDAFLREGFVRVGLVPGDGGAWLLTRLLGESKAREYLLTGENITATEAFNLGLVSDVIEDPQEAAKGFAEDVRDLPTVAVRNTKRLINTDESFDDHCERAIDYQWACVNDTEHEEAIAAIREDREPNYDR
jgi:2-(1,2-epoxy-1,2-dihydrophenyl)acetyl-CoA isomerase